MRAAVIAVLIAGVLCQDPKPDTKNIGSDKSDIFDENQYDRSDRNNQNIPMSDRQQFYLDSSTYCSNKPVAVPNNQKFVIHGRGSRYVGAGIKRCQLTLEVRSAYERYRFLVSIRSLTITDCGVKFKIIDGRHEKNPLGSYQCERLSDLTNKNTRLYTTGNFVTFILTRTSREYTNYDITLDIEPVREGTDNKCTSGNCRPEPLTNWKFEQKYIVLIIGLLYLTITALAVAIFIFCCIQSIRSGGKWHQRSYGYNNPAVVSSVGGTPAPGGQVWITPKPYGKEQLPRSQPQMLTKRVPVPVKRTFGANEDADSVFESDVELIERRRPQPSSLPRTSTHKSAATQAARNNQDDRDDYRFKGADDDHHKRSYIEREIIIPDKGRRNHRKYDDEVSSSGEEYETDSEDQLTHDEDEGTLDRPVKHSKEKNRNKPAINMNSRHDDSIERDSRQHVPPSYQESQGFPEFLQHGDVSEAPAQYRPPPATRRREPPLLQVAYNNSPGVARRYPDVAAPRPYVDNSQPSTTAPSYSYLVRRGYMERPSPASSAAGSHHSRDARVDDTDFSVNIDSGVELMKRTTDV